MDKPKLNSHHENLGSNKKERCSTKFTWRNRKLHWLLQFSSKMNDIVPYTTASPRIPAISLDTADCFPPRNPPTCKLTKEYAFASLPRRVRMWSLAVVQPSLMLQLLPVCENFVCINLALSGTELQNDDPSCNSLEVSYNRKHILSYTSKWNRQMRSQTEDEKATGYQFT